MSTATQFKAKPWWITATLAVERLETADTSTSIKDADWWPPLLTALEETQRCCEALDLEVLGTLSRQLLSHSAPMRSGVVELSPATLKVLANGLKKWVSLRETMSSAPFDEEMQSVLRALGFDALPSRQSEQAVSIPADVRKYLPLFVEETEEGVESMQAHLLQLEAGVKTSGFLPPQEVIGELFRNAHKLKASAAAMGFVRLSEMSHSMENVLERIRNHELRASPELVSILLVAVDHIRSQVQMAKRGEIPSADLLDVRASLMWYLDTSPGIAPEAQQRIEPTPPPIAPLTWPELSEEEQAKARRLSGLGNAVYRVALRTREGSLDSEMRLFLAVSQIGKRCEILASHPPLDQIESHTGLALVSLLIATTETEAALRQAAKGEEVEVAAIEPLGQEGTPLPSGAHKVSHESIRVPVFRLDELMNLSGELSITKNGLLALSERTRTWIATLRSQTLHGQRISMDLEDCIATLSQLVTGIQQIVLDMRMIPVGPLFDRCRRVVRDIATELGKDVDLFVHGADTLLDKKIVDQLGDPLTHMMRNAVDHGMEVRQERVRIGKPPQGSVTLSAEREGSRIVITVKDDGRGLNLEDIRSRAVELGLHTQEEANRLTEKELAQFIFRAGFSTARTVTHLSGRGVGMDIVRKRIEELNGTIEVLSDSGKGTFFRLSLPLTVVSQTCLLFEIHGVTFASPMTNIAEILRIPSKDVQDMKFGKFIRLRDEMIPVFKIRHFFKNTPFETKAIPGDTLNVIIMNADRKRVGLIVDEMRGEEEILVKHPGDLVGEIPGLAGVSVLGSGNVALILDIEKLVERLDFSAGDEGHDQNDLHGTV